MSKIFPINMDSFSDGQIASKLWLCDHLEKQFADKKISSTWIYGSWYGLLAFLLLSRERLQLEEIHLFDIDPEALKVSQKILDHWKFQPNQKIYFHHHDCTGRMPGLRNPDLLINTSVEHFHNYQWWDGIPISTFYALQSTDMIHEEHVNQISNLSEFKAKMNFNEPPIYEGTKEFKYPGFEFSRFMLLGIK